MTDDKAPLPPTSLTSWVNARVQESRDFYTANYQKKHDEYERIWRGRWSAEDKTRSSERSRLIAPALMQAVESNVADLEEATFGRGRWFNIVDEAGDPEKADVVQVRERLQDDFALAKVTNDLSEAGLIGAVYGTAGLELDLDTTIVRAPAQKEVLDGAATQFGVETSERILVRGIPVMPRNMIWDPAATCMTDAMFVGTDRYVSAHTVEELQEAGVYYDDVHVGGTSSTDHEVQYDKTIVNNCGDRVRLVKYYGLVPRDSLKAFLKSREDSDEELVDLGTDDTDNESMYVEAIIVLANDKIVKASENDFMMGDRPFVKFDWDTVPGSFMGRGVCEKGYNSQKALDAELRARIDALALTTQPMLGIDGSRMPRGAKPRVRPGKNIVTNGDPNTILRPFNFGAVDNITFAQAESLQRMVSQATGSIEASALPGFAAQGDSAAASMSMAMGAVMKRMRRTLMNFQNNLVAEFVRAAAYRYMQFNPKDYPSRDWTFTVVGTLGTVAREYEVGQMTQLLQTLPDGPAKDVLLDKVVEVMGLSSSEEVVSLMQEARKPNPEAQAMQQRNAEAEIAFKESQSGLLKMQAFEARAHGINYIAQARQEAPNAKANMMKAVADMRGVEDSTSDFRKRLEVASLFMKDREVQAKERSASAAQASADKDAAALEAMINEQGPTPGI